jgi:hypothetical protein
MWPGGMALHRNGLICMSCMGVTCTGSAAPARCRASLRLPEDAPYNSFVILDNGLLVTKNLSDTDAGAAERSSTPRPWRPPAPDTRLPGALDRAPERQSATRSMWWACVQICMRYHWDAVAHTLVLDDEWRFDYIGTTSQTYGWDVVLDGDRTPGSWTTDGTTISSG